MRAFNERRLEGATLPVRSGDALFVKAGKATASPTRRAGGIGHQSREDLGYTSTLRRSEFLPALAPWPSGLAVISL